MWAMVVPLAVPLAVGPESIPSHYTQAEQDIHPKRIGSLKSIQAVGTNPGATTKGPAICPNYTTIVNHIQSDWFGSMLVPSLSDWSCRTSISSGKLFQWVSPSWFWPLCSYSHSSHSPTRLSELRCYIILQGHLFSYVHSSIIINSQNLDLS